MPLRDGSRYNGEPPPCGGSLRWGEWRGNPPSGSAVPHGGNPQDRTASPQRAASPMGLNFNPEFATILRLHD
ncbi:MAG: hypothetical protein ACYTX0_46565, partial [Nostoc sp.]